MFTGNISCGNNTSNRDKKLLYDYDLISGKVNEVAYQPGLQDEFYHRNLHNLSVNSCTDIRHKLYIIKLKEQNLLPLFEKFIKDSNKGRRLKPDGSRIKPQTIKNYDYVLKYLQEYKVHSNVVLRIRVYLGNNRRILMIEKKD